MSQQGVKVVNGNKHDKECFGCISILWKQGGLNQAPE